MYSHTLIKKSLETEMGKAIIPYKKFKKIYTIDTKEEFKGKLELFTVHKLTFLTVQILVLNWIWDLWGFISMQQHLTELPRTEQPSLWTCCQLLEAPWAFLLGSPSSVEWRLSTLESRSSSKCSRTDKNKWSTLLKRKSIYKNLLLSSICMFSPM